MVVHNRLKKTEQLSDRVGPPSSLPEQLHYWRRQLEGVSVPELPIDQSQPTRMTSTNVHRFNVPGDMAARVTELVDLCGVALLELTVAVFHIVLARYTGRDDIATVTTAPGQGNPVVLRSRLTDSTSFLDFARKVRATVAAALVVARQPRRTTGHVR